MGEHCRGAHAAGVRSRERPVFSVPTASLGVVLPGLPLEAAAGVAARSPFTSPPGAYAASPADKVIWPIGLPELRKMTL